jgi:hypothetical protein
MINSYPIIVPVSLIIILFFMVRTKEFFTCSSKVEKCHNYKSCCINNKNNGDSDCRDEYSTACQKFAGKCIKKCEIKLLDDDENETSTVEECTKSCQKVIDDCCSRLDF